MEPFYFESDGERLFGVYHPALDSLSQDAVLICPPIYAEYFRTYRFLRQLAEAWAASGYHVLRFDYFGTGDSAGDWADGGIQRWVGDIASAVQELQDISGAGSVTLMGARFGATLAYLGACGAPMADRLIAWDPVVDGDAYLASLTRTHQRLLDKSNDRVRRKLSRLDNELAGFPRAPWIERDLRGMRLDSVVPRYLGRTTLVNSRDAEVDQSFLDHLLGNGVEADHRVFDDDCDWGTPSESPVKAFDSQEGLRQCL